MTGLPPALIEYYHKTKHLVTPDMIIAAVRESISFLRYQHRGEVIYRSILHWLLQLYCPEKTSDVFRRVGVFGLATPDEMLAMIDHQITIYRNVVIRRLRKRVEELTSSLDTR